MTGTNLPLLRTSAGSRLRSGKQALNEAEVEGDSEEGVRVEVLSGDGRGTGCRVIRNCGDERVYFAQVDAGDELDTAADFA